MIQDISGKSRYQLESFLELGFPKWSVGHASILRNVPGENHSSQMSEVVVMSTWEYVWRRVLDTRFHMVSCEKLGF